VLAIGPQIKWSFSEWNTLAVTVLYTRVGCCSQFVLENLRSFHVGYFNVFLGGFRRRCISWQEGTHSESRTLEHVVALCCCAVDCSKGLCELMDQERSWEGYLVRLLRCPVTRLLMFCESVVISVLGSGSVSIFVSLP
jgi:hypothetical protein